MDNAVRHGGAGVVKVVVASAGRDTTLVVEDCGAGLDDDDLQRLGQRFHRAPSARGSGSGLGLSIVGRIVELHGAALRYGRGRGGAGMRVEIAFDVHEGPATDR